MKRFKGSLKMDPYLLWVQRQSMGNSISRQYDIKARNLSRTSYLAKSTERERTERRSLARPELPMAARSSLAVDMENHTYTL